MLYLLDANTLIDANRDYYGIGQVDEYWEWLIHCGGQGQVKIPDEIFEELKAGSDALATWAKKDETKAALRFKEEVDVDLVRRVTEEGYAPDLNDIEIEKLGRDPFLIAYALLHPKSRVVVSTESSRPSAERQNRKIPDVCRQFGIRSCSAFEFGHKLGFRTDWKDHI